MMFEPIIKGDPDWHKKLNNYLLAIENKLEILNDLTGGRNNLIYNPDFEINQEAFKKINNINVPFRYFYDMWYFQDIRYSPCYEPGGEISGDGGQFSLASDILNYNDFMKLSHGKKGLTITNTGSTPAIIAIGQVITLDDINYYAGKTLSGGFVFENGKVNLHVYADNTATLKTQSFVSKTYETYLPQQCEFEFMLPDSLSNYKNLRLELVIKLGAGESITLANVFMVEGENGTYIPRAKIEELNLCRQYYQFYEVLQGYANSSTYYSHKQYHLVTMAKNPTARLCTSYTPTDEGIVLVNEGKAMLLNATLGDSAAVVPQAELVDTKCIAIAIKSNTARYGVKYSMFLDCRPYL